MMKLTIKDRLILLQILPQQASLKKMGSIIECFNLLSLSDEEKAACDYKEEGGKIKWNASSDSDKDIPLKHDHISVLKESIELLDSEQKVTIEQYATFVKIAEL
ncbi:MAG: hypothetical protein ACTTKN_06610 [Phocaeicola sp.]|uniref:hypothetical protein n=1 Tax=Phocaeicola sp. TaxID=2773926 RepID=UPI003F9FD473